MSDSLNQYFAFFTEWDARPSEDPGWLLEFPIWITDRWSMRSGKSPKGWNPRVFAMYERMERQVDFPSVVAGWHVMSQRMRDVVERVAPGVVEFLPFRIRSMYGDVLSDRYFVANYRFVAQALDRAAIKRKLKKDFSLGFGDLRPQDMIVKRKQIDGKPMLRVTENNVVVCNKDVKEAIEQAGVTGCFFVPVEAR